MLLTIQEMSERTGLSTHTLRYYEKEGLLVGVERSEGGYRRYNEEDVEQLGLILCLKNTGMSIQEISQFMALSREGDSTLGERVELLKNHREKVICQMEEKKKNLDKVTAKLEVYRQKLSVYEGEKGEKR